MEARFPKYDIKSVLGLWFCFLSLCLFWHFKLANWRFVFFHHRILLISYLHFVNVCLCITTETKLLASKTCFHGWRLALLIYEPVCYDSNAVLFCFVICWFLHALMHACICLIYSCLCSMFCEVYSPLPLFWELFIYHFITKLRSIFLPFWLVSGPVFCES